MKLRTAVIISVGLLVILGLANIRHFMGRGKSDTAKGTSAATVVGVTGDDSPENSTNFAADTGTSSFHDLQLWRGGEPTVEIVCKQHHPKPKGCYFKKGDLDLLMEAEENHGGKSR